MRRKTGSYVGAKLTFSRLQSNQLRIFTLTGTVKGLHAGIVHGIEVETVNGANCFLATVNFLQKLANVEFCIKACTCKTHSQSFTIIHSWNSLATHSKLPITAIIQFQDLTFDKGMIWWLPRNGN